MNSPKGLEDQEPLAEQPEIAFSPEIEASIHKVARAFRFNHSSYNLFPRAIVVMCPKKDYMEEWMGVFIKYHKHPDGLAICNKALKRLKTIAKVCFQKEVFNTKNITDFTVYITPEGILWRVSVQW